MTTLDDVRLMLKRVECGGVTVVGDFPDDYRPWQSFDSPTYTTSDGWTIKVFNDAGCWDYIEYVVAPDGTRFNDQDFREDDSETRDLAWWHPHDETFCEVWKWA